MPPKKEGLRLQHTARDGMSLSSVAGGRAIAFRIAGLLLLVVLMALIVAQVLS